jgi:hypothetical protein
MDRIIITIADKKTGFQKRVVLEVKAMLMPCDFITIGDELMFDKDTDFIQFGYDVSGDKRQLAIITGEFIQKPAPEAVEEIKESLKDRFDIIGEDEQQVWMREK